MKRTIRIAAIAAAVIIVCGILLVLVWNRRDDTSYMIEVNKREIPFEEYVLFMERQKPQVYAYFSSQHEAEPENLQWDVQYEQERPLDLLCKKTEEQIIENTFILETSQVNKQVQTFEAFKILWQQEMDERAGKHEAGHVVYGPVKMDLFEYYDYFLGEAKAKAMEHIWREKKPSKKELTDWYEENKKNAPKREQEATAIRIYIEWNGTDNQEAANVIGTFQENLKKMEKTPATIEQVNVLIQEMNQKDGLELKVESIELKPETHHYGTSVYPSLWASILEASKGSITEVTKNSQSYDFAIVEDICEDVYFPYEDVEIAVEHDYKLMLYGKEFEQWKEDMIYKEGRNKEARILKYQEKKE